MNDYVEHDGESGGPHAAMGHAEHSMGWLDFREAMAPHASSLSNSNCPMVLVLNDKEIRFDDVKISLVPITIRRGNAKYQAYEYHIKLIKKEPRHD